ncbi:hypothetical protein [Sediminispirochaeta bajacaliforniensis]|uniref:hypothetical protein n=1 Tax=Sediminispirochaeta bajacaliforniensis TaxID=148 RepID=UPI00035FC5D8|nr:hypothetical protein [Sediminispirochaeta bajacaliforniensis]
MKKDEHKTLTELYLLHQKGMVPWNTLKNETEIYCYEIACRMFRDQDACMTAFVEQVFDKIPAMLQKFQYKGHPLEHYLSKTITLRCKAIRCRVARKRQRELLCRCYHYASFENDLKREWFAAEYTNQNAFFIEETNDYDGSIRKTTSPKKILLLALREAEMLDDPLIGKLSEITGKSVDTLVDMVTQLRACIEKRKSRYHQLKERRNSAFAKMIELEIKLWECNDPAERTSLREAIVHQQERIRKLDVQLRNKHWHPTQSEIAEVIGIPKGTVGSAIHYLHCSFENFFSVDDESDGESSAA